MKKKKRWPVSNNPNQWGYDPSLPVCFIDLGNEEEELEDSFVDDRYDEELENTTDNGEGED